MSNIDKLREKIRALILKAQSTTFEGEAESFMAKAFELMEKYQIHAFELSTEDPIGCTPGVAGQPGMASYKPSVQCVLAKYYGAKPVYRYTTKKDYVIDIFGPESARATTELMTPFVWAQICDLGKTWGLMWGQPYQKGVREVSKAFVDRVRVILNTRPTPDEAPGFSLAVIDLTAQFVQEHYNAELTKMQSKTTMISHTASALAATVNFAPQINTPTHLNLK
jgi:hypothetical protein